MGVEVDVTRQDDTTVGVRQVLFLAAHVLTVVSSPSPALHVSLILAGAADHSTIERLPAARTFNPHITSRGGLDKAIRRCKAGVSEDDHRSGANSVRDCDFSILPGEGDSRVLGYQ